MLLSALPSYIFPHEADTITIMATVTSYIQLEVDGQMILQVYLTPDSAGRIHLTQLAPLIRDHTGRGVSYLRIFVDRQVKREIRIIPAGEDIGAEAEGFGLISFLTRGGTQKLTWSGATERLAYLYTYEPARVRSFWLTASGSIVDRTQTIASNDDDAISTIDVSPSVLLKPAGAVKLIDYEVTVGEIRRRYILQPDHIAQGRVQSIAFINSFGIEEHFHFFGLIETGSATEWTKARIGGQLTNLRVVQTDTLRAATGPISQDGFSLLKDLIGSTIIWRVKDGRPLYVENIELTFTDQLAETQAFTVTFRMSRREVKQPTTTWSDLPANPLPPPAVLPDPEPPPTPPPNPTPDPTPTTRASIFDDTFDFSFQ